MIKFIKALPFHFKTAVKSFGRHLAMSISAASAVTVTLVLMSIFMILAGNVTNFTRGIEEDIQIHVIIDPVIDEAGESQLESTIKAIPNVKKVTFSSKEDELEAFIKEKGKLWDIYRGDANPMRDAYIVDVSEGKYIKEVTKQIKALDGIMNAQYGGDTVNQMISAFATIRNGGLVFVLALSMLAIFLIQNTIKMTIYARNKEIAIMRNVGAVNSFIKMPFMIEGMFIGLIGAVIPVLITFFGYQYLYNIMGGNFMSKMFVMEPVFPFAVQICGILVVAGVAVGVIGSFLSVTKYLKWKR